MHFTVPDALYQDDTIYHWFKTDDISNIFGCGFICKDYSEPDMVFDHYGAVLVLNGRGLHVDEHGTETTVSQGCLIQRIPQKVQSLLVDPDSRWLEFFICISKKLYYALNAMDLLDSRQDVLFPGLNHAILNRSQEFHASMKHTPAVELNMLVPEAIELVLMLQDLHRKNTNDTKDGQIIEQACSMLSKPDSFKYTVQEVSASVGLGYEKFRKLFKSQVGVSPGRFAMLKRMDVAKSQLLDRNKSVKCIALELGFSDTYSFSKQFKKLVGISPSQFRLRY